MDWSFGWLALALLASPVAFAANYESNSACSATDDHPAVWGHVYMSNAIEAIDFHTAFYSDFFPCGFHRLVMAEPADGCSPITNDVVGAYVLVDRGTCAFVNKSEAVGVAGGLGTLVANSADLETIRMPSADTPKSENTTFDKTASVMLSSRSGLLLKEALRHAASSGLALRVKLQGDFQRLLSDPTRGNEPCGGCKEVLVEATVGADGSLAAGGGAEPHLEVVPIKIFGGVLRVAGSDESFDFFVGEHGSPLPVGISPELGGMDFKFAEPLDACAPLTNADELAGRVVVIKRGACTFLTKFEHVRAAGGAMALLLNSEGAIIVTPAVERDAVYQQNEGFSTGTLLPSATVHSWVEPALRAAQAAGNSHVSLRAIAGSGMELYEDVFAYDDAASWPTGEADRRAKLSELLSLPKATQDMKRYVEVAYARALEEKGLQ